MTQSKNAKAKKGSHLSNDTSQDFNLTVSHVSKLQNDLFVFSFVCSLFARHIFDTIRQLSIRYIVGIQRIDNGAMHSCIHATTKPPSPLWDAAMAIHFMLGPSLPFNTTSSDSLWIPGRYCSSLWDATATRTRRA
jgi:hypothetical protein